MSNTNNKDLIDELASSQAGVFTSKQAEAFGIPRYALSYAAKAGHIERICHGAYHLGSSLDPGYDELAGLWMLTRPGAFAHDRMRSYDGVVVCGTTAAAMHGIGDFFLSPYHIAVPRRFNSRGGLARYPVMTVPAEDVTWLHGLPVTTVERTLGDLVAANEDISLVANALVDAIDAFGATSFSIDRLESMLGEKAFGRLLDAVDIGAEGQFELIRTDSVGHVALRRKGR